jgi:ABC-2 type transport system ATP-binding protein
VCSSDLGEIIIKGVPSELIKNQNGAHNLEDVFLAKTGKALRDYA